MGVNIVTQTTANINYIPIKVGKVFKNSFLCLVLHIFNSSQFSHSKTLISDPRVDGLD